MRAGLFGIILSIGSFMLGLSVADDPSQPMWVWALGFAIIGLCIAGIFVGTWMNHQRGRRASKVRRADSWERKQQQRRYEEQLDAFWQSPAGKWVQKSPFLANDSVRIQPIRSGQLPKTYLGLLILQISETHVAHIQTVVPLRWNHRAMRLATWLANHRMLPECALRWLGRSLGYKYRESSE